MVLPNQPVHGLLYAMPQKAWRFCSTGGPWWRQGPLTTKRGVRSGMAGEVGRQQTTPAPPLYKPHQCTQLLRSLRLL